MPRQLLVTVIGCVMMFVLTACGGSNEVSDTEAVTGGDTEAAASETEAATDGAARAATEEAATDVVVGHSFPDLQNPYYISVRDDEQRLFDELGYELITTDSTQDPATQAADIENLVQRGVDVLFIDAVDPQAVVPGVEAANEADIPVVALIREPAGGEWETLVFLDSVEHGRISCEYIVEQLGGEGSVVELQGIMATQPGRERSEGCNMALDEAAGVERVAQQEGNFNRVDALNAMDDIIQAQPQIDAVFGANDEEALGAIEAIKAAGIDPASKVIVGIDGTQVALESICEGELAGTLATIGREEAQIITELAQQIVNGEDVPERVEFPGTFVTSENVEEVISRSGFELDCVTAGS